MVQTLATLLFLLAAGLGAAVIAASLIDDWALMMRALGFRGRNAVAPLPPRARAITPRQTVTVSFARRQEEWRVAA